ncbi:MAG: D-alanyl-D-alanine carboxypeptidase family protein [Lysobacterales bacterium]
MRPLNKTVCGFFSSTLMLAALTVCGLANAAPQIPVPAPPQIGATSYILLDHHSGAVLASQNVDQQIEPASITKLMTSYIVFSELQSGGLNLEEMVPVSEKAWRTEGSKMFIEVGTQVKAADLLKGMIVQSGNDASVALAEHIAGSEETFAALMNQYAQSLGMNHSNFLNATGLPAPQHLTTARDIATLSQAIIRDFPEYYRWYSEKEFTFNEIRQHNRNNLLWRDPAVDGLKTGHTSAAGYCLAASAQRSNMRLISVVMGSASENSRADDSQKLLNYGFRFFETHRLYGADEELSRVKVWKGETEDLGLGIDADIYITIPSGQYDALRAETEVMSVLTAPMELGTEVGNLRVFLDDELKASAPLLTLNGVQRGGLWRRMSDSIALWFHDFGE